MRLVDVSLKQVSKNDERQCLAVLTYVLEKEIQSEMQSVIRSVLDEICYSPLLFGSEAWNRSEYDSGT